MKPVGAWWILVLAVGVLSTPAWGQARGKITSEDRGQFEIKAAGAYWNAKEREVVVDLLPFRVRGKEDSAILGEGRVGVLLAKHSVSRHATLILRFTDEGEFSVKTLESCTLGLHDDSDAGSLAIPFTIGDNPHWAGARVETNLRGLSVTLPRGKKPGRVAVTTRFRSKVNGSRWDVKVRVPMHTAPWTLDANAEPPVVAEAKPGKTAKRKGEVVGKAKGSLHEIGRDQAEVKLKSAVAQWQKRSTPTDRHELYVFLLPESFTTEEAYTLQEKGHYEFFGHYAPPAEQAKIWRPYCILTLAFDPEATEFTKETLTRATLETYPAPGMRDHTSRLFSFSSLELVREVTATDGALSLVFEGEETRGNEVVFRGDFSAQAPLMGKTLD